MGGKNHLNSRVVLIVEFYSILDIIKEYLFFTGMNLNTRELHQHVEFEPDTYYAAFSAELEISASPMWSLISHCKTKVISCWTFSVCLAPFLKWLNRLIIYRKHKIELKKIDVFRQVLLSWTCLFIF